MFTQRDLKILLQELVDDLMKNNISPRKVILFGSYAKGNVHTYSDVDLAVWSDKFSGDPIADFECIHPVIKKYRSVNVKLYPTEATADSYDPFIGIIEKTGIPVYEEKQQTTNTQ
jgi:predicted nucleotidyltransferase